MANEVRMLRGNVTILFAAPEAFADWQHPKAAELNAQFSATDNPRNLVFNVSCAILDGYSLGETDPDTDNTRTICDISEVENPTLAKYEGKFTALRDESVDDQGVFNMIRDITMKPDITLFVVERIGKRPNKPFEVGDVFSIYRFQTDYPVDGYESNGFIKYEPNFLQNGAFVLNEKVAA